MLKYLINKHQTKPWFMRKASFRYGIRCFLLDFKYQSQRYFGILQVTCHLMASPLNYSPDILGVTMLSKKQNWLITLLIIFFSFSSVYIALICIYALPDGTSKPMTGVFYLWGGAAALSTFLYALYRKQFSQVETTISDKLIRWLVTVFSFFFALGSIIIALVCIFALPDGSSQPQTGVLYFLGGVIVISNYVVIIYRNYSLLEMPK